jgi:two-component system LytT family sensor kinase
VPNPRFLAWNDPLRSIVSPPADVVLPSFQEGTPERWIVLSNGGLRPALTAQELGFVTRIAGMIQVRIATILGELARMEKVRRESIFREELANAELRALRAQINPHFLFNSLNTIADLSAVAPDRAEKMTLRLSAVFRYVLANTERSFASIQEEISFARSYLEIEEVRFGERLKVRFDVEPSVLEEKIPSLLLQPLIENALKHGLGPKLDGGTLELGAKSTVSGFVLTVADDGVGLYSSPPLSWEVKERVGVRNVKKRLHTAYEERATFTLAARAGGGTEARIAIQTEGDAR